MSMSEDKNNHLNAKKDEKSDDESISDDDLFAMFPEGTRIIIHGNKVTFENLTPELLDVARSLNPDDENLKKR